MSFEHCHFCEPPTRYPGCQDHCPHYAADISALRAGEEEPGKQVVVCLRLDGMERRGV